MEVRRLIASLSLIQLLAVACDSAFEPPSTLPQRGRDANPPPTDQQLTIESSLPLLEPATPATLFEHVAARARRLARIAYSPWGPSLPEALTGLSYEQYRSIRFRPEASLWQDKALFAVQLFHPGFLYLEPVRIYVIQDEQISELHFDKTLFRYDGSAARVADVVTPELGYAGFRIHYPYKGDGNRQEVVVFLGASYLRLLGPDHVHGLSSRGLAVDIALDSGEEFPAFKEFWLVRPTPEASTLTFFALLDSPSVTGAYRFDLEPGSRTTLDVDARLYARRDVAKLGVAPLSSMFLYGHNRVPSFDDFRPQVHDSDGLLMHTAADEWIWRPLANGPGLQVTSLRDDTPRGFGLVQRDRDFDNYLDLEANYHRRPSEWVAFGDGDWGSGGVELLAIPTDSEFNDNIAAIGAAAASNCWPFPRTPNSTTTSPRTGYPTSRSWPAKPRHWLRSNVLASAGMPSRVRAIDPRAASADSSSTSAVGKRPRWRVPSRSKRCLTSLPVGSSIWSSSHCPAAGAGAPRFGWRQPATDRPICGSISSWTAGG